MGNKKQTYTNSFTARLMEVLAAKPVGWWLEKLNIAPSLISSRWKKGSYPSTENIIKICKLSGVSPTWLLLGSGPKYHTKEKYNDEMSEQDRDELQKYIQNLERQLANEKKESKKRVEEIESNIENIKITKWFFEMFSPNKDLKATTDLQDIEILEPINKTIIAAISFLKENSNEILDKIQQYILLKTGEDKLEDLLIWINDVKKK